MKRFQPMQNLILYEALKLFTKDAAYLAFEEDERGTLDAGKLGDIAIAEGDLWKKTPEEIRRTKILYTITGGEVAYQA